MERAKFDKLFPAAKVQAENELSTLAAKLVEKVDYAASVAGLRAFVQTGRKGVEKASNDEDLVLNAARVSVGEAWLKRVVAAAETGERN